MMIQSFGMLASLFMLISVSSQPPTPMGTPPPKPAPASFIPTSNAPPQTLQPTYPATTQPVNSGTSQPTQTTTKPSPQGSRPPTQFDGTALPTNPGTEQPTIQGSPLSSPLGSVHPTMLGTPHPTQQGSLAGTPVGTPIGTPPESGSGSRAPTQLGSSGGSGSGSGSITGTLSADDIIALRDLYDSLNGPQWNWNQNANFGKVWDFSNTVGQDSPCLWQGISCSCTRERKQAHLSFEAQQSYYGEDDFVGETSDCVVEKLALVSRNLTGRIPDSIGALQNLTKLRLSRNRLSGTIPPAIGTLTNLQALGLSYNGLTGPLPEFLSTLTSLRELYLSNNELNSTIPVQLGLSLVNLVTLDVSSNQLTGSLPPSISGLAKLNSLLLSNNKLRGSVPSNFASLSNLQHIQLTSNQFSGDLPVAFGAMSTLWDLVLTNNNFRGTIPAEYGALEELRQLQLGSNQLTGTLPDSFAALSKLSAFDVSNNLLNGTIPGWLGGLTSLNSLKIDKNSLLSGTIPSELGRLSLEYLNLGDCEGLHGSIPETFRNLSGLTSFLVQNSRLTGTLPDMSLWTALVSLGAEDNAFEGSFPAALCAITSLEILNLQKNMFTGTLPECVGSLVRMKTFNLFENSFSGTLPESMKNLVQLTQMQLSNNQFSGTLSENFEWVSLTSFEIPYNRFSGSVPSAFARFDRLKFLDLSYNLLTGEVSSVIANMTEIDFLFLQNNDFSGSIEFFMDPATHRSIANVDVSNNQFTGRLPADLFRIANLGSFAAVKNCFTGSIPETICVAQSLQALALDGLHTASSCKSPFYSATESYSLSSRIQGTIPVCLFEMPTLQLLHISGNGLVDTLPATVNLSASLQYLSLSHNQLYGSVPLNIQNREWSSLDLSFNKLTGVLADSFNDPTGSLRLHVNRISGTIPSTLHSATSIELLDGNMFECNYFDSQSALPRNDSVSDNYECGNTFTQLSYIWMSPYAILLLFVGLCAVSILLTHEQLQKCQMSCFAMYKRFAQSVVDSLGVFDSKIVSVKHHIQLFRTLMEEVRTIACCITVFIVLLLVPVYVGLSEYYSSYDNKYSWTVSAAFLSGKTPAVTMFAVLVVLAACMVTTFNHYMFRHSARLTKHIKGSEVDEKLSATVKQYMCLIFVALLNFGLVTGVNVVFVFVTINYSRFYLVIAQIALAFFKLFWNDVVLRALLMLARYLYSSAAERYEQEVNSTKSQHNPHETRNTMFQVFIVLMNNIVVPCLATAAINTNCFYFVLVQASSVDATYTFQKCTSNPSEGPCNSYKSLTNSNSYDPPFIYSYQCSSALLTSYASTYVYMFLLIGIVLPLKTELALALQRFTTPDSWMYNIVGKFVPALMKAEVVPDGPHREMFEKDKFVRQIISNFAVLTTFGAVFPPLTVVILMTMYIKTYYVQWKMGDILLRAEKQGYNIYKDTLNVETHGLAQSLIHSMWLLVPFSCLFYSVFIFDTYADAEGWRASLGLVLTMAALPILLWSALKIYNLLRPRHTSVHPAVSDLSTKVDCTADSTADGVIPVMTILPKPGGRDGSDQCEKCEVEAGKMTAETLLHKAVPVQESEGDIEGLVQPLSPTANTGHSMLRMSSAGSPSALPTDSPQRFPRSPGSSNGLYSSPGTPREGLNYVPNKKKLFPIDLEAMF